MVRKLIKYDFASYMRILLPVQLILLGIAALNRFIQLFEDTGSAVYNIVFGSSVFLYVVSIIVCLLLTTIVALVRFYKGLYSSEGYLSHTLPVTPSQHIFSKLLVSMIFEIGSVFAVFLSFCISTLGELNIELFKAGGFLLGRFYTHYSANTILYIIEFIVLLLVATASGLLMLYFCISLGQLAKKHKVLAAFGVYFGLYIISQILGTILVVTFATNPWLMGDIAKWAALNLTAFFHIAMCGGIILSAILGVVYFLITRYIMSKKLNLT